MEFHLQSFENRETIKYGLEKRDKYHTPNGPSTISVTSRNQKSGIIINKGRGSTWASIKPHPGFESTLLFCTKSAMTHLLLSPEQLTCKLYGQHISRKYSKSKNIWGLITQTLTTCKCQHNLITIGVCTPAQN